MEGQDAAPIPTDQQPPQGEFLSPVHLRRPPVDGLSGSGLDRLLHPPGDDEQPDDPRKGKNQAK